MDKTETYVKMCGCEEVQGQHGYRQGIYAIDDKIAKPYRTRSERVESSLGSFQWIGYILGKGAKLKISAYFFLSNYPPLKYISAEEWKKFTWLPTQDQIQGMVDVNPPAHKLLNFIEEIHGYIEDGHHSYLSGCMKEYYQQFQSMEQLWLAFYMHEKHNKTWDGEKWVKNK